jgi:two-component sensor histidine kinase
MSDTAELHRPTPPLDSHPEPAEAWSLGGLQAVLAEAGLYPFALRMTPAADCTGLVEAALIAAGPAGARLHPEDRDSTLIAFAAAMAGVGLDHTTRLVCPDGTIRWIRASAGPLAGGKLRGVAQDVTDARLHAEALERALAEKELLLREIDHRVKNSLQLAASLIGLQAASIDDERMRAAFDAIRGRVQAIAAVHASLYREEEPHDVDARLFLCALVHDLARLSPLHAVQVESDETRLPAGEAASLAIGVNELLSNAFKHAYPGGHGPVSVSFRIDGARKFRLEVADAGALPAMAGGDGGIGLRILDGLARRWRGSLRWETRAPGKACILEGTLPT